MDNGAINEIQLLDKYMLAIKSKGIGHKLYEISRNLDSMKYFNGKKELKDLIGIWSVAENESGKDFVENREAYTKSAARAYAISLVIKFCSSWSQNHFLSAWVKGLSFIDPSLPEGISLATGEGLVDSILKGISLISTYSNSSDISAFISSISDNQAFEKSSDSASASRNAIEAIEGERRNPDAPVNGEMDLSKLVDVQPEDEVEESLDESLFPVDTSELNIDKLRRRS